MRINDGEIGLATILHTLRLRFGGADEHLANQMEVIYAIGI